ncbi:MAG: DNA-3-methyladenine glycosylase family protein [Phycisphaerales bacterium JB064]
MAGQASPARPTRLRLAVPADFDLSRDVCSYGYFLLDPYDWSPAKGTFSATLSLEHGAAHVVIRQQRVGMGLSAAADRSLTRGECAQAREMITRMLRLDESEQDIAAYHAVDDRWRFSGRGRLMRSATLFEDMAKTITSCNVQWPGTIDMNAALCARVGLVSPSGRYAFPTPERLARKKPEWLRSRCRVGYRDKRLVELAKMFHKGQIDEAWLTNQATSDDEVRRFLLDLPGIGPYAAHNIMQLLGRYGFLPLDTESVRHGRSVLGFVGSDREVLSQVTAHYERFGIGQGGQAFRSYWLDLWMSYETSRGPAHTWDKRTTGRTFTAAQLKDSGTSPKRKRRSS